ncbi:MAG: WbqC family protein [Bacteroidetes bacterium]|nr:WbqC family protein [Bacteroidota bacterium]
MDFSTVVPSGYLPPITYFTAICSGNSTVIDQFEYFEKQTYRNRCEILSANGILKLVIPLDDRKNKSIVKDCRISYKENWQKKHWKSIESAYNRSPYFEFYKDDFIAFYEKSNNVFLIDFNTDLLNLVLKLLKIKKEITLSSEYIEKSILLNKLDLRTHFHNNSETIVHPTKKYIQVFSDKFGFVPNLSIIDLLFNCGPEATSYL